MNGQLTIFDWLADLETEPSVGEYLTAPGAVIPHIMRPAYIGKKVLIDVSTVSHPWFLCGTLEDYIPYENTYRSIVFTGKRQRSLITHRGGATIYECLPWSAYPERRAAIGGGTWTENKR